jgi:hypothetical protein
MAKNLRVLVLGNDPQINEIDFSRLPRDIVTLGVNRIWLKHIPRLFFFNDVEILKELERQPEVVKALSSMSNCFSSDWLTQPKSKAIQVPNWVKVYPRPNKHAFPDSVTTAISIFRTHILKGAPAVYYIAGVSLKWSEPSHFWKQTDHISLNQHDENWYLPRFERILENFKNLSLPRHSIVSVHPDSLLNKYYRYEGIENLYSN